MGQDLRNLAACAMPVFSVASSHFLPLLLMDPQAAFAQLGAIVYKVLQHQNRVQLVHSAMFLEPKMPAFAQHVPLVFTVPVVIRRCRRVHVLLDTIVMAVPAFRHNIL